MDAPAVAAAPETDPRSWLIAEWEAGRRPSGADLARRFGKSERRGQQIIREVEAEADAPPKPKRTRKAKPQPAPQPAPVVTEAPEPQPEPEPAAEEPEDEPATVAEPHAAEPAAVPGAARGWTVVAVAVVALAAAVISFAHQWDLARAAGEGWRAWLLPLSVDGLILAASLTMYVRRRLGLTRRLAIAALVAGIVASIAANIAAADPTAVSRIVAAWPPLALLVAYELLIQQIRPTPQPEPAPAPALDPEPEGEDQ